MNQRIFTIYLTDWVITPDVLIQTDRVSDDYYFLQLPLFVEPKSIIEPLKEAILLHFLNDEGATHLNVHLYLQTNAERDLDDLKQHHKLLASYIDEAIKDISHTHHAISSIQTRVTFIDTQKKSHKATPSQQKSQKSNRYPSSFRGQVSCG